ncbi:DNA cytosine methyltransferase [Planktomarina temperata]|nr:DNA cytosine methyltransferase [Planktomarina temperata]
MQEINQLDLFSGIGGFHLGFERAGYKVNSYFSEVDKHAVAVYKNQFKNSTYVGSVTDVRGEDLPRIDLITFGSPCQDFSLAGKRKGMEGERSSLITEAIRLVHECRPRVFIWENVKGTFSSNNGADFWAIIQAFANIGGYRCEWQLCNTSWFLPQNRERIYFVGYLAETRGDWRGVFPIGENDRKIDNGIARGNQYAQTLTARYFASTAQGSYIGERNEIQEIKVKSATSKEAVVEPTTCIGGLQKNAAHFEEKSPALTSAMGMGGGHTPIVDQPNYRIRRLTPIECERLQGFPDNHTEYGNYDGEVKKMSNTQRYKQCGNAVTVDVVQAIANKLHPLFQ